jgi:transketolase
MRDVFCRSLVRASGRDDFVFLTGDLGFKALEPLREAMGAKFVNAGVAEQNMVSVAAGLARNGLRPWAYSIAPFIYARPFEQIRNDVCLHKLPVVVVGNGGGYGYGVMGATHHALEDYGVLATLPGLRIFAPVFDEDVDAAIEAMSGHDGPAYLRLGRGEKPAGRSAPAYAAWRRLRSGSGPVVVAVGPIAGLAWAALDAGDTAADPEIWALSELPIAADPPPAELVDALQRSGRLCVVEEHVAHGGAGQALATWCLQECIVLRSFRHLAAQGYRSGTYGSQGFHRRESGLDGDSILGATLDLAAA